MNEYRKNIIVNKIKLVKLRRVVFIFTRRSALIFDVYVLLIQTIALLNYAYFLRITNVWFCNIILSLYVIYLP